MDNSFTTNRDIFPGRMEISFFNVDAHVGTGPLARPVATGSVAVGSYTYPTHAPDPGTKALRF
jgi:hypothetical protein